MRSAECDKDKIGNLTHAVNCFMLHRLYRLVVEGSGRDVTGKVYQSGKSALKKEGKPKLPFITKNMVVEPYSGSLGMRMTWLG